MHDLILNCENSFDLALTEEQKQAIGNVFTEHPRTQEGQIINLLTRAIDIASDTKVYGNWTNDGFFSAHKT